MLRSSLRRLAPLGVALACACTGTISSGDPDDGGGRSDPNDPDALDVGHGGLRRLTPREVEATLRDLVGDPELTVDLDADEGVAISRLAAEKLNGAAEKVASREATWQASVFPCDTNVEEDLACVDAFIETFGRRAFRRPVSAEETAWLKTTYASARAEQTFHDALVVTLQVILQSPQFLYRVERGVDSKESLPDGVLPLSGYERAVRLSYFLLGTTPSDALLDAAEDGLLDTADGVGAIATELLADARARATVTRFVTNLLEIDGTEKHASLADGTKSEARYPEDSPELRAAMREEIVALVERVAFDESGTFADLLTTTEAKVDGALAQVYGVAAPSGGSGWVTLPERERAGLLTRAGFLTLYSRGDIKSPIRRGAFIVKNVFCVALGDPPPNANDTPIEGGTVVEGGQTVRRSVRQDVEKKTLGEGCSSCHTVLNPVGFAFDNYDALGRWESEERGTDDDGEYTLPIDPSGQLPAGGGAAQPVSGPIEASRAIAASPDFIACMSERWFTAAHGREATEYDRSSINAAKRAFGDGSMKDALVAIAQSDAFLYLRPEAGE